MKIYTLIILTFSLLTCHQKKAEGKSEKDNGPFGCYVNDLPNGFELVCDGKPHQCLNGKDGAQGAAGHNGSPGVKGDPGDKGEKGDKGDTGPSGRSISKVLICHIDWEGSPAYKIDYLVFTYSDNVRESVASIQLDSGEIEGNSAIWIKDDPRSDSAPVDVGGFAFTQTGTSAVVLYRSSGRTSEMACH